jgi:hypothetical protein
MMATFTSSRVTKCVASCRVVSREARLQIRRWGVVLVNHCLLLLLLLLNELFHHRVHLIILI